MKQIVFNTHKSSDRFYTTELDITSMALIQEMLENVRSKFFQNIILYNERGLINLHGINILIIGRMECNLICILHTGSYWLQHNKNDHRKVSHVSEYLLRSVSNIVSEMWVRDKSQPLETLVYDIRI